MGTFKIKFFFATALCVAALSSCEQKEAEPPRRMVSLEQYESAVQEYRDLSHKQEAIIQKNIENDSLINVVVKELRSLTNATMNLRMDVESGSSSISNKPDEIKARLEQLKRKLNTAQKTASADSKHFIATIQNLRNIIEQKENEIISLKDEIAKKNKEIKTQSTIISNQKQTIQSQQNEMLKNQMNSWFSMGTELKNIASVIPSVKGKKDKSNISNTKLHILERAKICFDRAAAMGHPNAAQESKKIADEMRYL